MNWRQNKKRIMVASTVDENKPFLDADEAFYTEFIPNEDYLGYCMKER